MKFYSADNNMNPRLVPPALQGLSCMGLRDTHLPCDANEERVPASTWLAWLGWTTYRRTSFGIDCSISTPSGGHMIFNRQ